MFAHIHRLVVSRFRRGAPVHFHAMTAGADGCGFEHQEKVEQDDEESEDHRNEHQLRGNFPHHVRDRPAKNENNANHTEGAKPPLETFPSGLVFAIARETCRIQPGEIENFPHGSGRMGYCVLRRQARTDFMHDYPGTVASRRRNSAQRTLRTRAGLSIFLTLQGRTLVWPGCANACQTPFHCWCRELPCLRHG